MGMSHDSGFWTSSLSFVMCLLAPVSKTQGDWGLHLIGRSLTSVSEGFFFLSFFSLPRRSAFMRPRHSENECVFAACGLRSMHQVHFSFGAALGLRRSVRIRFRSS